MAFRLGAAIGGAAKRASEIIEQEREDAFELIDSSLKTWGTLGTQKLSDRNKLRKNMENVGKFLKSKGFSDDQIASAWHQNRHQEVADHIRKLELAKVDYKPSEIISFLPEYESSGLTLDEQLDGVLGKVRSGMNVSDAISDMGGAGLQGMFMQQRANAASAASGINIAEMRALATDDLEYGTAPGGTITLEDPVAAAQAEQTMAGGEAGMFSSKAATNELVNFGNLVTGAKGKATAGGTLYIHEATDRAIQVSKKVTILLADKQKELGRNRLSLSEINDVKDGVLSWAKDSGLYAGADEKLNDGNVNFADDPQTVEADTIKNISDLTDKNAVKNAIDAAVEQIRSQLVKKGDPEANKKAMEARDRMVKAATGKSADKKGSSYHRSKYPDLYDEQGNLIEQE